MQGLLLLILSMSSLFGVGVGGFKVSTEEERIQGELGGAVNLTCRSDNYYEYCKFTSPAGEECNFEWRRKTWNITMKSCVGLQQRIRFSASYNDYECGIEVSNLSEEDVGQWKCQMEQYVFGGSRGSGLRAERGILVYTPTTTTTTTTTARTSTTTSSYSTRRKGRILDLDVDLDRKQVSDSFNNVKSTAQRKMLAKMFQINLISGCVAVVVIFVFIILFVYLVVKHRQKVRNSDEETMNITSPVKPKPDPKPEIDKNRPLSYAGSLSRRTSLSSVVPSIAEDIVNEDDIKYMKQIFPHIIALSPEEKGATVL